MVDKSRFLPTRLTLIHRLQAPANTVVWNAAWSEFYQVYWRVIYSSALRKGLSQDDAIEIVQIVLVKIQRGLNTLSYDPAKGRFLSWVGKIALRGIYDYLRQKRCNAKHFVDIHSESGEGDPFDNLSGPAPESGADTLDSDIQQAIYAEALARVRARRKDVVFRAFELHYVEGLPVAEVAKQLGIEPGSVSVSTNRLKAAIKEEGRKIREAFEVEGYLA